MSGLAEASAVAVAACRKVLDEAHARREQLGRDLGRAGEFLRVEAAEVAGGQFPVGRVLEVVNEVVAVGRSPVRRLIRYPIRWFRGPREQFTQATDAIKSALGVNGEVQTLEEFEARALAAAGQLIEKWRDAFPASRAAGGPLTAEVSGPVRTAFNAATPPAPKSGWEQTVRDTIRAWSGENLALRRRLTAASEYAAGGALIGLLALTVVMGGLFAPLAAAVAVAGGAGSTVIGSRKRERDTLIAVAEETVEPRRSQRTGELIEHLTEHLLEPLFRSWEAARERLDPDTIAACESACANVAAARLPSGFQVMDVTASPLRASE